MDINQSTQNGSKSNFDILSENLMQNMEKEKSTGKMTEKLSKNNEPERFWNVCCYGKTIKQRFRSIAERRPSALEPLDGLRAVAILWVFYFHTAFNYQHATFQKCVVAQGAFFRPIQNGDLGVDLFFVLSGFLITFILLKECEKYDGKIDYFNFIRSRFLRIWPVIPCITLWYSNWKEKFTPLIFANNLFYLKTGPSHLWSVAVEFQFYFISPFVVWFMYRYR